MSFLNSLVDYLLDEDEQIMMIWKPKVIGL